MKQIINKNKKITIITIITGLFSVGLNVYAGTTLSKFFVEETELLVRIGIYVLIVWSIAILSTFIYEHTKMIALSNMRGTIRNYLTTDIYNLEYKEYINNESGDYLSMFTNDTNQMVESGIEQIFNFVLNLATVLTTLLVLYKYHIVICLIAILLFLFVYFSANVFNTSLKSKMSDYSKANSKFQQKILELINSFVLFKNYDSGELYLYEQSLASNYLEDNNIQYLKLRNLASMWSNWINLLSQLILLFIATALAIKGHIDYGVLIVISNVGGMFFSGLIGLINSVIEIKTSQVYFKKLSFEDLKIYNTNETQIKKLELKNISYKYGDKKILNNKNLTVTQNDKIAIVGESGSGKSTFIKIIMGLLNDYSGTYIINGDVIKSEDTIQTFNRVAYVGQDHFIFNDTIKNNLTKFAPDTTHIETINNVIDKLNLSSLIKNSDDDINTVIEENGKNLSKGQSQRLSLARAILSNRDILILDEVTSSLDEDNKKEIENYLLNLKDRTIIFVSHNLSDSALKQFDQIIYI